MFWDDCGVWDSNAGGTPTAYYVWNKQDKMVSVLLKNGKYSFKRQMNKKPVYVPLDAQPPPEEVLVMR